LFLWRKKSIELLYKLIFCSFAIVGASLDLTKVIDLSDSSLFLMAIPNLIGVYILANIVKKEYSDYSQKHMN
jgi:Na+/alanine symporter